MSGKMRIADAKELFRQLLRRADPDRIPATDALVAAVREFAGVDFEVADNPDADGCLFQYGTFAHLPEPGFVIGFLRQFCLPEGDGEDEGYVQLSMEYRYEPVPEIGRQKEWWFKSEGSAALDEWLAGITGDPVWTALAQLQPVDFSIRQEYI
jgi:hypothetical protein